jgi:hypothetical protein
VDTWGLSSRYQFCATNTITRGDTELDVPLFLPGAVLPTPTLSGQVFTVIDGKREPLAGVGVYYSSRGYGVDVAGATDSEGRYSVRRWEKSRTHYSLVNSVLSRMAHQQT